MNPFDQQAEPQDDLDPDLQVLLQRLEKTINPLLKDFDFKVFEAVKSMSLDALGFSLASTYFAALLNIRSIEQYLIAGLSPEDVRARLEENNPDTIRQAHENAILRASLAAGRTKQ